MLKYTEKRAGNLSLRYLKGPFRISRSQLVGMGKECRLLWKVYERGIIFYQCLWEVYERDVFSAGT